MEMIGVASLLRMMPMGYEEACYSTKASDYMADEILDLYRYRWQVELYFKRLKSILNYGELPKKSEKSIFAWLNGKLMVALLVESVIGSADFSPCKYDDEEYLEGDENDKPVIINQPV